MRITKSRLINGCYILITKNQIHTQTTECRVRMVMLSLRILVLCPCV